MLYSDAKQQQRLQNETLSSEVIEQDLNPQVYVLSLNDKVHE